MENPEYTEAQIDKALAAETERDIQVMWNGDILSSGDSAFFDILIDGDKTEDGLYVEDTGGAYYIGDNTGRLTNAIRYRETLAKVIISFINGEDE